MSLSIEEAIRRVRACRDDHRCEREEACFVLMRFAERRLALDVIEADHEESDEVQYFATPACFFSNVSL